MQPLLISLQLAKFTITVELVQFPKTYAPALGVVVGPVVSCTVTLNVVGTAPFPALSVAVHVTVVFPIENDVPDAGRHVAGNVPLTKSVAFGDVYVAIAPPGLVASAITEACTAITGTALSIVILLVGEDKLLSLS